MRSSFEALVAEGAAAPVTGWDFSWLEGHATEERPAWGYSRPFTAHSRRFLIETRRPA